MHSSWAVWGLSFLLATLCNLAVTADESALCRPQGLLKLDAPHAPPQRPSRLPFCQQYDQCSCCNATHVSAIFRTLQPAFEDTAFSDTCKHYSSAIACRVCDPQVGVGAKLAVCGSFCQRWYSACASEYFSFDPWSGALVPCGGEGQQALLCTKLKDTARDAHALCAKAGFTVALDDKHSTEPCFDGKAPKQLPASCAYVAPSPAKAAFKAGSKEIERKSRSGFQRAWSRFVRRLYRRLQPGGSAVLALGVAIVIMYGIPWLKRLMRNVMESQQGRFLNDGDYDPRFPGKARKLGAAPRTNKHKKRQEAAD